MLPFFVSDCRREAIKRFRWQHSQLKNNYTLPHSGSSPIAYQLLGGSIQ